RQHRRGLTVSFQKGMVDRVRHRLDDMKAERDDEHVRAMEEKNHMIADYTSTDIVHLKNKKVEDAWEDERKRLGLVSGTAYRSRISSRDAYRSGSKAGDNINL